MDNPHLKLNITKAAYHAVLDQTFKYGLTNPLPVLYYNNRTNEYEIEAYCSADVDKMKRAYTQKGHNLVYQIGRINICIENLELAEQLEGKTLDYIDGKFIINEPQ